MNKKITKKIVITGGHFTPALAVIEELKSRGGWEIYYFSRKYAFEGKKILAEEFLEIPKTGADYISITAGRLQRKFTRYTLLSLLRIPLGFLQSFYHLWRIKPAVVLSFGSYTSTPVVIAGWLLRIPVISHEQTISEGLANKINAFFSQKIAVSFSSSLEIFPPKKAVLTGNPLRKAVFNPQKTPQAREVLLRLRKTGLPLIYITGGNLGSRTINQTVGEILPKILKKFVVVHQCGLADLELVEKAAENLPEQLKERYFFKSFWPAEEIGWLFKEADLVITRAGANITYELGALRKSAILIPLPFAQKNEQLENARQLVACGLGLILAQKELTPQNLWWSIEEVSGRRSKYRGNSKKLAEFYHKDGSQKLADLIDEQIKEKN